MMKRIYRFFLRRFQGAASEYHRHERLGTIPNAITLLGIGGVVWYCYLFLTNSAVWVIPLLHIGIVLTDALDGIVADKFDQHSRVGMYLDPLRDRMHAVAMLGNLAFVSQEIWIIIWVTTAIAAEGWIALLFLRVLTHSPHMAGKIRVAIYGIFGLVALTQLYWVGEAIVPLSFLASIMTMASVGASLFYTWLAIKQEKRKEAYT